MRVLLVSDLLLYREGAAAALAGIEEIDEVSTADCAATVVVAARRSRADVVLLDLSMTGAMPALRALMQALPRTRVVAVGIDQASADLIGCAELGVTGYVGRNATLDELRTALHFALRGEAWCSGRVAADLIRHISRQRNEGRVRVPLQITRRELDVLNLLECGLSNKEIARALDLSLSTVKNHVHNLLSKLGVARRAELLLRGPVSVTHDATEGPHVP